MAFRFVHTADLHLDSPLKSLALRDPELAGLVETATREAFRRTIDLCLAEEVDALLIAGDLYDGEATSMKTAAFLAAELGRLAEADVRAFVLKGNHDARSGITRQLDLPAAVATFDGRGQVHALRSRSGDAVAVHGVSWSDPHAAESLLPKYRPPAPDAVNVALMHTSLDGAAGHDPYSPTPTADLVRHGMDYWALGHIHRRGVHGDGRIVMPGIPQGRHVNEAGPKSVTLATVDRGGVRLEERSVATVEFARVEADIAGAAGLDDVRQAIRAALAEARAAAAAPSLIARLALAGDAPVAWRLRRDAELLAETAREIAARIGGVWVEAVELRAETRRPAGASHSAPDELAALIAATLATPEFANEAKAIAEELIQSRDVPEEARDAFGADDAARARAVARLAEEGAAEALARLTLAAAQDETAD